LTPKLHARHVVRRIDDEEQREGDEVHPDQDRDGVEQATNDVGKHCRDYAKSRRRMWLLSDRQSPAWNAVGSIW
jgi:hypothetical protein